VGKAAVKIHPRQALVADIGGTNARFGIADIDQLTIAHFAIHRVDRFPSLEIAVKAYLDTIPDRPRIAAFAIAGPIAADIIRLTNAAWSFTRDGLLAATGADELFLVNDFEALALALPHLMPRDLHQIGGEASVERAAKAVIGPGTGLGVGGLVWSASGWTGVPSEGGHVTFAVENAEELAIVDRIRSGRERVSAERMICGPGLASLYRVLTEMKGGSTTGLSSVEVVGRALAETDPLAGAALRYFVTWLGRFAGDAALFYGARGGVYLGGGIPPKILDALTTGTFRAAFEAKGRMSGYLAPIPVYVIDAADAGLTGAAVALATAMQAK